MLRFTNEDNFYICWSWNSHQNAVKLPAFIAAVLEILG